MIWAWGGDFSQLGSQVSSALRAPSSRTRLLAHQLACCWVAFEQSQLEMERQGRGWTCFRHCLQALWVRGYFSSRVVLLHLKLISWVIALSSWSLRMETFGTSSPMPLCPLSRPQTALQCTLLHLTVLEAQGQDRTLIGGKKPNPSLPQPDP